jgi:hypothetical protein
MLQSRVSLLTIASEQQIQPTVDDKAADALADTKTATDIGVDALASKCQMQKGCAVLVGAHKKGKDFKDQRSHPLPQHRRIDILRRIQKGVSARGNVSRVQFSKL